MTFEYQPTRRYDSPIDPKRCKASVHNRWLITQCSRTKKRDGWCEQHHPDTRKALHKRIDEQIALGYLNAEIREQKERVVTEALALTAYSFMEPSTHARLKKACAKLRNLLAKAKPK